MVGMVSGDIANDYVGVGGVFLAVGDTTNRNCPTRDTCHPCLVNEKELKCEQTPVQTLGTGINRLWQCHCVEMDVDQVVPCQSAYTPTFPGSEYIASAYCVERLAWLSASQGLIPSESVRSAYCDIKAGICRIKTPADTSNAAPTNRPLSCPENSPTITSITADKTSVKVGDKVTITALIDAPADNSYIIDGELEGAGISKYTTLTIVHPAITTNYCDPNDKWAVNKLITLKKGENKISFVVYPQIEGSFPAAVAIVLSCYKEDSSLYRVCHSLAGPMVNVNPPQVGDAPGCNAACKGVTGKKCVDNTTQLECLASSQCPQSAIGSLHTCPGGCGNDGTCLQEKVATNIATSNCQNSGDKFECIDDTHFMRCKDVAVIGCRLDSTGTSQFTCKPETVEQSLHCYGEKIKIKPDIIDEGAGKIKSDEPADGNYLTTTTILSGTTIPKTTTTVGTTEKDECTNEYVICVSKLSKQACADYNGDGYLEKKIIQCIAGSTCVDGMCVNPTSQNDTCNHACLDTGHKNGTLNSDGICVCADGGGITPILQDTDLLTKVLFGVVILAGLIIFIGYITKK